MTTSSDLELLLDRYLAGECSADEQTVIREWASADADHVRQLEQLQAARLAERARVAPADVAAATQRLTSKLDAPARLSSSHRVLTDRTVPHRGAVLGLAAAVFVTAAVFLVTGVMSHGRRASAGRVEEAYATRAGERSRITLRDGTQMVLAPDSRVRIDGNSREVQLDGEAYFAVVHDANHPFSVRTAGTMVQDVGTRFVVRAYRGDADERVAVAEGEVRVAAVGVAPSVGPALSASAGDVAIQHAGAVILLHPGSVQAYTAWLQGGLVFDATPLRDVVRDLARTYDLDITVADSTLLNVRITTSIGAEPVDEVLGSVAVAIGARYERSGRRVVIQRQVGPMKRERGSRAPQLQTANARAAGI